MSGGKTFEVFRLEIPYRDPIELLPLFAEREGTVFLDSAKFQKETGQFSFLCVEPFSVLQSKEGKASLDGKSVRGDPFLALQGQLKRFLRFNEKKRFPFEGGVAGFFSYDLCRYIEPSLKLPEEGSHFSEMALGFYDLCLCFDHEKKEACICSSGLPEQDPLKRKKRARQRAEFLLSYIGMSRKEQEFSSLEVWGKPPLSSSVSKDFYEKSVDKIRDFIRGGDVFEVNLSHGFFAKLPINFEALKLYQTLRECNPAPFASFVQFSGTKILSASPERFLRLKGRKVQARPMKGTRPRGTDKEQDDKFAQELVSSEKDRAENVMIVDLMRNDLSKVCEDDRVLVKKLCSLESYATVHQLVSVVEGHLKQGVTAVDLLEATFPGGSITGAPKQRAMQIIYDLEKSCRGPYCGSIGYIGFDGDMDLSIVIRSFVIKGRALTFRVGGAVLLDSDPSLEYQETLNKAYALKTSYHDCFN